MRRGDHMLFEGLDWALGEGGALVLNGPNGSGKSSLLRVIAGLLRPTRGSVEWEGKEVHKSEEYRATLHYIGHSSAVKAVFTVLENVKFWSDVNGGTGIVAALEFFGLRNIEDVPGRFLSAGQRRRVALANLLTAPRRVWLLDEPSVGLDEESALALGSAIEVHRAKGGLVVAATHGELQLKDAAIIYLGEESP